MWSSISRNREKLVKSSTIVWVKQSMGEGRRVPKFGGARPGLPVIEKQQHKTPGPGKAGDGNRDLQKKEQFAKVVEDQKLVIMAAGKRIPLIKFPNRRAGETQGFIAVGRASGGGGRSQATPSLPSGTASSQPPRTKLSEAEIEAVLLGGVLEEPDPKKAPPKKK